ncbi:MAG: UvrD-helicase domain-containing protein [Planctomycetes bacterium]|nr:UvrD-helicase domain-containing protein [Planctomycetota bacterium]
MQLTDQQRAAIEARGTDLLVAASAGSGKTEVLARRCVSLITDTRAPCGVDQLLVVTFTRAAAAELRVRLARMLREAADEAASAQGRQHLRRQEILVDTAHIGTIDAWCGRVVHEHFVAAGVDAGFSVLGAEDAELLRHDVLDELFQWIYTADDALAAAARAWIERSPRPSVEFLQHHVSALSAFREHLVDPSRWFEQQRALHARPAAESVTQAVKLLAAALVSECRFQQEQLAAVCAECPPEVAAQLAPYQTALAHWRDTLADDNQIGVGAQRLLDTVAEIAGFKIAKPRGLSAEAAALLEEVRQRWLKDRLQKRAEPDAVQNVVAHADRAAALVDVLLQLEQRYQALLSTSKRRLAAYEFADVLRLALDLLGTPSATGPREPTAVARRLQQRYEHVLVDEYQDTSPVQVEILRLVSRAAAGQANRFMVGDVKQSIYGFRQAEPRLFAELGAAFECSEQNGRVLPLTDNFRSHALLLDGLNRLFTVLFDRALGGTPYGEQERLRAGRTEIDTGDRTPRIALHLLEYEKSPGAVCAGATDRPTVDVERIEREAAVAARTIQSWLRERMQIPERAADGTLRLRPLRLGDVVILLRSAKRNAGLVAHVLRSAGLPCVTSGREALLDALQVLDVRNALALLVNRRQDLALAAYLRGPMVGLTADELLRVRHAAPPGDFLDAVEHYRHHGAEAKLIARLERALRQLDGWSGLARQTELPELLRHILQDTALPFFAHGLPGGAHRLATLLALQQFAADFSRAGQRGVAEFVAHLDRLAERDVDPGAPVAAGQDAVRIMTIHAAKGLEFPLVFLLNTGAEFSRQALGSRREWLYSDPQHGLGLKSADYPARETYVSAAYEVGRHAAYERELAEELRLLYVAATRARERFVVIGHVNPGAWEEHCLRHGATDNAPPLISRLGAKSTLEWVLRASAAGRLHEVTEVGPVVSVTTYAAAQIDALQVRPPAPATPAATPAWTPEDDEWLRRSAALLDTQPDTAAAELPAVLSVSAVKEITTRAEPADRPAVCAARSEPLRAPAFAARSGEIDGRVVGTACHRFLQHADLTRLTSAADIREQLAALVSAGRLTSAEAGLIPVADVAWFGSTAEGRLLATHAPVARREVPFVCTLPLPNTGAGRDSAADATIIRGVIDCLVETAAGLTILDYKTDRPPADQLEQRVAGYGVQMQAYAYAADRVFARPVLRTALVFLRLRRIVAVPPRELTWDILAPALAPAP